MDPRFEVVTAVEEEGFARVVPVAQGARAGATLVTEELSVEDREHRAVVRLKEGDLVAGTVRGRRLVGARLVRAAAPPIANVRALAGLVAELSAFGFAVGWSAESIAMLEWRRDPKRMQAKHPVLGQLLRPQIVWLVGDRGASAEEVRAQLLSETRALAPAFELRDDSPPLPSFEPWTHSANSAIEAARKDPRWSPLGDDWILALPEAARLLRDHVFRVASPTPTF